MRACYNGFLDCSSPRLRHPLAVLAAAALAASTLAAAPAQSTFLPIDEVRPGMVGVGRTVFAGDRIDEFNVEIIGVLKNIMGPRRNLILARLEGARLADTGVIQGMSGSPVYVDGRLVGAVSYSLGSFPLEPLAGITPIGEMIGAVDSPGPRASAAAFLPEWPATPQEVFASLRRIAERAAAPLTPAAGLQMLGPASMAEWAPALRPIRAALVLSGFAPDVGSALRQALAVSGPGTQVSRSPELSESTTPLRPGDPVGASLIRGDLEMGASGTVTYVDQGRVYAFGHSFLNLGSTTMAMTRAHVYAVLPSLESSMKIATLGPVVGTLTQDRTTAIGGRLGSGPDELRVSVTLRSDRAPEEKFTFYVLQDELLTPLFSYVAVLNALSSYERQAGTLSIAATGTVSFGDAGDVALDDAFVGEAALPSAAAAATAAIGVAATNPFRAVLPKSLDLTLTASEQPRGATIERAWLNTNRPKPGGRYDVQVLLRDYRGGTETVSIPVTMPSVASGPLTLLVSDGPTLTALEQRELRPGKPHDFSGLIAQLNAARRNNRIYVRLLDSTAGAVVAGETLPALPESIRSVLTGDTSVESKTISRTVVGSWEQRLDRAVQGSREIAIRLDTSTGSR